MVLDYINKFQLLSPSQKRRTVDAIAGVIEELDACLDGKIPACYVFFDSKTAFDTINHSILLEKSECMGFTGPVQNLFKSYLQAENNTYRSVKISHTFAV